MKLIEPNMSGLISRLFVSARLAPIAAALCLALVAAGCEKKVAVKATPPVLVPSIESSPEAIPEPQPEPAATIPTMPPPAAPEPDLQKPRPKPRKAIVRAKPEPPKPAEPPKPEPQKPDLAKPAEPAKPAAPDSSVQITAAVPSSAAQSQTQNTEQLLRSSESKLAGLNRSLNQSEQSMANQARNYIAQSQQAMKEGEIERAYNLAVKASLLAAELAK